VSLGLNKAKRCKMLVQVKKTKTAQSKAVFATWSSLVNAVRTGFMKKSFNLD